LWPPGFVRSAPEALARTGCRSKASRLVGRERVLTDLHDLIQRNRLLTLTGPGGGTVLASHDFQRTTRWWMSEAARVVARMARVQLVTPTPVF